MVEVEEERALVLVEAAGEEEGEGPRSSRYTRSCISR